MTIKEIIDKRGIEEILHFTTNSGITGMLATGCLKARTYLKEEELLEYIYKYNCENRCRDKEWWSFVNLSITTVNRKLFGISKGIWHSHEDGWWCILSFSPEICCHENVYFSNTNNMYTGVKRQKGVLGLETLFGKEIIQWTGKVIRRSLVQKNNQPTCEQAEVLYPREVSFNYLKKVYVSNEDEAAKFDSIKALYPPWNKIPCEVRKDLFT